MVERFNEERYQRDREAIERAADPEVVQRLDAQWTDIGRFMETRNADIQLSEREKASVERLEQVAHNREQTRLGDLRGPVNEDVITDLLIGVRAQLLSELGDDFKVSDETLVELVSHGGQMFEGPAFGYEGQFYATVLEFNDMQVRSALLEDWDSLSRGDQVTYWDRLSTYQKRLLLETGRQPPSRNRFSRGLATVFGGLRDNFIVQQSKEGLAQVFGLGFNLLEAPIQGASRFRAGATEVNPAGLYDAATANRARMVESAAERLMDEWEPADLEDASVLEAQSEAALAQSRAQTVAGEQAWGMLREVGANIAAAAQFWRTREYWDAGGGRDTLYRDETVEMVRERYDLDDESWDIVRHIANQLDSKSAQDAFLSNDPALVGQFWQQAIDAAAETLLPGTGPSEQQARAVFLGRMLGATDIQQAVFTLVSEGRISFGRNAAMRTGYEPGTELFASASGVADAYNQVVLDPLNAIVPARNASNAIFYGIRATDTALNSGRILRVMRGEGLFAPAGVRRSFDEVAQAATENLDLRIGPIVEELTGEAYEVSTATRNADGVLDTTGRAADRIARETPLWTDAFASFARFVEDEAHVALTQATDNDLAAGVIRARAYRAPADGHVPLIVDDLGDGRLTRGIDRVDGVPMLRRGDDGVWRIDQDWVNNEAVNFHVLQQQHIHAFRAGKAAGVLYKVPLLTRHSALSLLPKWTKKHLAVAFDTVHDSNWEIVTRLARHGMIDPEDVARIAPQQKGTVSTAFRTGAAVAREQGGAAGAAKGLLVGAGMLTLASNLNPAFATLRIISQMARNSHRGAIMVDRATSPSQFRDMLALMPAEFRAKWVNAYTGARTTGERSIIVRSAIDEMIEVLGVRKSRAGNKFADELLRTYDERNGIRGEQYATRDSIVGSSPDTMVDPASGKIVRRALGEKDLAHAVAVPDMRRVMRFARFHDMLDLTLSPAEAILTSMPMDIFMGRIWNPFQLWRIAFGYRVVADEIGTTAIREGLMPLIAARMAFSGATNRHLVPKLLRPDLLIMRRLVNPQKMLRTSLSDTGFDPGGIVDLARAVGMDEKTLARMDSPRMRQLFDKLDQARLASGKEQRELIKDLEDSGQFGGIASMIAAIEEYAREASPYAVAAHLWAEQAEHWARWAGRANELGTKVSSRLREGVTRMFTREEYLQDLERMIAYSESTSHPVAGMSELMSALEGAIFHNPSANVSTAFREGGRVADPFNPHTMEVRMLDFLARSRVRGDEAHDPFFLLTMQAVYERRGYDHEYQVVTDAWLDLVEHMHVTGASEAEVVANLTDAVEAALSKDPEYLRRFGAYERNTGDVVPDHLKQAMDNLRGPTPPPPGVLPSGPIGPGSPGGPAPRRFNDQYDLGAHEGFDRVIEALELRLATTDAENASIWMRRLIESLRTLRGAGTKEHVFSLLRTRGIAPAPYLMDPATRDVVFTGIYGPTLRELRAEHGDEAVDAILRDRGFLTESGRVNPFMDPDLGELDHATANPIELELYHAAQAAGIITREGEAALQHAVLHNLTWEWFNEVGVEDLVTRWSREMYAIDNADGSVTLGKASLLSDEVVDEVIANLDSYQAMFSEHDLTLLRSMWESNKVDLAGRDPLMTAENQAIWIAAMQLGERLGVKGDDFVLSPLHTLAIYSAFWPLDPGISLQSGFAETFMQARGYMEGRIPAEGMLDYLAETRTRGYGMLGTVMDRFGDMLLPDGSVPPRLVDFVQVLPNGTYSISFNSQKAIGEFLQEYAHAYGRHRWELDDHELLALEEVWQELLTNESYWHAKVPENPSGWGVLDPGPTLTVDELSRDFWTEFFSDEQMDVVRDVVREHLLDMETDLTQVHPGDIELMVAEMVDRLGLDQPGMPGDVLGDVLERFRRFLLDAQVVARARRFVPESGLPRELAEAAYDMSLRGGFVNDSQALNLTFDYLRWQGAQISSHRYGMDFNYVDPPAGYVEDLLARQEHSDEVQSLLDLVDDTGAPASGRVNQGVRSLGPPPPPRGIRPGSGDGSAGYRSESEALRQHAEDLVESWMRTYTVDPLEAAEMFHLGEITPANGRRTYAVLRVGEDGLVRSVREVPPSKMNEVGYTDVIIDLPPSRKPGDYEGKTLKQVRDSLKGPNGEGPPSRIFLKPLRAEDISHLEETVEAVLLDLRSRFASMGVQMGESDPVSLQSLLQAARETAKADPIGAKRMLDEVEAKLIEEVTLDPQAQYVLDSRLLQTWHRLLDGNGDDRHRLLRSIGDDKIGIMRQRSQDPTYMGMLADDEMLEDLDRVRAIPTQVYSTRALRSLRGDSSLTSFSEIAGTVINEGFRPLLEWADWMSRQPMTAHYYVEAVQLVRETLRNYFRDALNLDTGDWSPGVLHARSIAARDMRALNLSEAITDVGPDWAVSATLRTRMQEAMFEIEDGLKIEMSEDAADLTPTIGTVLANQDQYVYHVTNRASVDQLAAGEPYGWGLDFSGGFVDSIDEAREWVRRDGQMFGVDEDPVILAFRRSDLPEDPTGSTVRVISEEELARRMEGSDMGREEMLNWMGADDSLASREDGIREGFIYMAGDQPVPVALLGVNDPSEARLLHPELVEVGQKGGRLETKAVGADDSIHMGRVLNGLPAERWVHHLMEVNEDFATFVREVFPAWLEKSGVPLEDIADQSIGVLLRDHVEEAIQMEERIHAAGMVAAYEKVTNFADVNSTGSLFAMRWRNAFPFYWAEERFIRRVLQSGVHSPETFRRLQLTYRGLDSHGFFQEDEDGDKIFVYPEGWLPTAGFRTGLRVVLGREALLPVQYDTGVKLRWMVSGLDDRAGPEAGPVVAWSVRAMADYFPEWGLLRNGKEAAEFLEEEALDERSGNPNVTLVDMVLPGWTKRLLGMEETPSLYMGQIPNAIAQLEAAGHIPEGVMDDTTSRAELIRRVTSWTRVLAIEASLNTFAGFGPGTPVVEGTEYQHELRDLQIRYGFEPGLNEFVRRYPDMDAYQMYVTESRSGGPLPATEVVYHHLRDNEEFFREHPDAAHFFLPDNPEDIEGDGFYERAYYEQVDLGLRRRIRVGEPEEVVEQVLRDMHFQAVAADYFRVRNHWTAMSDHVKGTPLSSDLQESRERRLQWIIDHNPLFAEELAGRLGDKDEALRRLSAIESALADDRAPRGKRTEVVEALLALHHEYDAHKRLLENRSQRADLDDFHDHKRMEFIINGSRVAAKYPEYGSVLWNTVILPIHGLDAEDALRSVGVETIGEQVSGSGMRRE